LDAKDTALPPLLDSRIVSRDSEVPLAVYVPMPTSHVFAVESTMV
jgi:hypothetical protein